MSLLEPLRPSLKALGAFPTLNLCAHGSQVGAELEPLAVMEPDIVVCFAAQQIYARLGKGCVQVGKGFVEEAGEEEERWALVEAMAVMVDEGATSSGEVVLLDDGDLETCFGETSC